MWTDFDFKCLTLIIYEVQTVQHNISMHIKALTPQASAAAGLYYQYLNIRVYAAINA